MNLLSNETSENNKNELMRLKKSSHVGNLNGPLNAFAEHITGVNESVSVRTAYTKWRNSYFEFVVESLAESIDDWPELSDLVTNRDWIVKLSEAINREHPTVLISELGQILRTSLEKYPNHGTRPRMSWFLQLVADHDKSEDKAILREDYHKIESIAAQAVNDQVADKYIEMLYEAIEEGKKEQREDELRRLNGRKYFPSKDNGVREVTQDEADYWKKVDAERKRLEKYRK